MQTVNQIDPNAAPEGNPSIGQVSENKNEIVDFGMAR